MHLRGFVTEPTKSHTIRTKTISENVFYLLKHNARNKSYNKTCATSSEDSDQPVRPLIACAFYSLQAILRGMDKTPCHAGFMYWLIQIFAGHTGLIVGLVMHWLKWQEHLLTLKTPRKPASENGVRFCRMLYILANFSNLILHTGKQCGP